MIRGFWTARTGLNAQQHRLDTVANNLANVNTVGFKPMRTSFKDLMYQNINRPDAQDTAMTGAGVKVNSNDILMRMGNLAPSGREMDMALLVEGDFFAVENAAGEIFYTRAGNFYIQLESNEIGFLVDGSGNRVLDADLNHIELNLADRVRLVQRPDGGFYDGYYVYEERRDEDNNLIVDAFGNPILFRTDAPREHGPDSPLTAFFDGTYYEVRGLGRSAFDPRMVGVFRFPNAYGLENVGNNLFAQTDNSGEPDPVDDPRFMTGYLEGSAVDIAQEMVYMIESQRAFSLNSRVSQTADEVEQTINNLR